MINSKLPFLPSQTLYLLNAIDIHHSRLASMPVAPPKGAHTFMEMLMPVHSVEDLEPYVLMERKRVSKIQPPFTWKKVGCWVWVATHSKPFRLLAYSFRRLCHGCLRHSIEK